MLQLLLPIIYLAFISLGLPDSLLGSAWPSMYEELSVPVSYSGFIFMIIAFGTVVSSLQSDRLTRKFGPGRVTAGSVLMTAAALLGFSLSGSYLALCLWAVPYGLGAGSVDASLNNYVALHYKSRHMSWLHCMWGIGAASGPYIMSHVLTTGLSWQMGYRSIAVLQFALTALLFITLPLWRLREGKDSAVSEETKSSEKAAGEPASALNANTEAGKPLKLSDVIEIPGAKEIMITFFCYSAIEQTANLWAGSYLVLGKGVSPETAAGFAGLFFIGITAGRFFNGFLTVKFSDTALIRLGAGIIFLGVILMFLHFGEACTLLGLIFIGLGCAPVYPSIIHSTPFNFGKSRSQALIGVEMASAYIGTCLMPPIFGFIADKTDIACLPFYLLLVLFLMFFMHERMLKKLKEGK